MITTGEDSVDYAHTIEAPVAAWTVQDENGQVALLEIVDRNKVKTILSLEEN